MLYKFKKNLITFIITFLAIFFFYASKLNPTKTFDLSKIFSFFVRSAVMISLYFISIGIELSYSSGSILFIYSESKKASELPTGVSPHLYEEIIYNLVKLHKDLQNSSYQPDKLGIPRAENFKRQLLAFIENHSSTPRDRIDAGAQETVHQLGGNRKIIVGYQHPMFSFRVLELGERFQFYSSVVRPFTPQSYYSKPLTGVSLHLYEEIINRISQLQVELQNSSSRYDYRGVSSIKHYKGELRSFIEKHSSTPRTQIDRGAKETLSHIGGISMSKGCPYPLYSFRVLELDEKFDFYSEIMRSCRR